MPIRKRFFHPIKNFSVEELLAMLQEADLLALPLSLPAESHDNIISDIVGLHDNEGEEGDEGGRGGGLAYITSAKYMEAVKKADNIGLLLVPQKLSAEVADCGKIAVATSHAEYAFTHLARQFYPYSDPIIASGDEAIAASASIGDNSRFGHGAIIGDGAIIGADTRIGAYSVIGDHCVIGDGCDIGSHCVIRAAQIGDGCRIQSGSVIGERGYGVAIFGDHPPLAIPHIGGVFIGDHVEIAANCTIDRGKLTDTTIGNHVKLDNLVHIAHNVTVGDATMMATQVGVAGSVTIGRGVMIGGQVAVAPGVVIGDGAVINPCAGVHDDVAAGARMIGTPAQEVRDFARSWAAFKQLGNKWKG